MRGIPAGKVKVPILWGIMAGLLVAGFGLAWLLFPNRLYIITLAVLMGFALLYNINPIRLKDKAFLDVISESINNPLRLLLGWYAVVPADYRLLPPLSIIFAWWFFGALLMTGKRYSEYRFIGDDEVSGRTARASGLQRAAADHGDDHLRLPVLFLHRDRDGPLSPAATTWC